MLVLATCLAALLGSTFASRANARGTEGGNLFEIEDFSFDIEQTINIGSE